MSKICLTCKEEKLLDNFTFRKDRQSYIYCCKPCERLRDRKSKQKNWITGMVKNAKAKDKKKKFNNKNLITRKYIENQHKLQNNKCFYCDCEMKYGIGINRQENIKGITLERISSNLPHTNSNCVLICSECNTMKNATDFRKFVEKCTYISNKFKYVFD